MGVFWILLRLFFVGFMAYVLYKLLWKSPASSSAKKRTEIQPEPMERDPVCGAFIPRSQAVVGKYNREILHFCSTKCREEFEKNPERFLN